ncbi:hypothetical protein MML48_2g00002817 [Holotrichia oblita]|uniref:Uncharacterized protein n=1 Tax=Holotrichia oblita TaxID=644536 RepID=A0ACB9TIG1_HOLOL|nr:hypothetical protein MML48_2g00002817 [Holotrichia oblita]
MSDSNVPEDVKKLISEIISRNNWEPVSEPKYSPACESGDGYICIHLAVEIPLQNETIRLFVKYPAGVKLFEGDTDSDRIYLNEIYLYNNIIVSYNNFLDDKGVKDRCVSAPKSYGSSAKHALVLDNLIYKGYKMFDRKKLMNDQHIKLVLKSFAKFHGTSFAFKDQKRSDYDELAKNCGSNVWKGKTYDTPVMKVFFDAMKDAFAKFDPEKDQHLLERCKPEVLIDTLREIGCNQDRSSIITKGDCWSNNMMFLYENDNTENPIDVMQLDWQLVEVASPVYDISYFFYTTASQEALSKLDDYLEFYYSELSEQIQKLGSDPKYLYPFSAFKKEWKLYCKFGFALAFMVFRVMLANPDEVPDMTEMHRNEVGIFDKFVNEEEYMKRIKLLAELLVERNYI